jgi:hypothetical protein
MICQEKFLYVRENYDIFGKFLGCLETFLRRPPPGDSFKQKLCSVNCTELFLIEKTVLARFPDNAAEIGLKWLNESYVDLKVFNIMSTVKINQLVLFNFV